MLWWELEEVVTDIRVGAVSTFPPPPVNSKGR